MNQHESLILSPKPEEKNPPPSLTYSQKMGRWLSVINQPLYLCWIGQIFASVESVVPMGQYPSTPRKWLQISSLLWLPLMCQGSAGDLDQAAIRVVQVSRNGSFAQQTHLRYLSTFASGIILPGMVSICFCVEQVTLQLQTQPDISYLGRAPLAALKCIFLFFFPCCTPAMWDLSFQNRGGTHTPPALESGILTTGPLGKSLKWLL